MKNLLLFIGVWFGLTTSAEAQKSFNIDSLRHVMATLAHRTASFANDSSKIKTLENIVWYHYMHTDSGLYYSQQMLTLSKKINWSEGIVKSYLLISQTYQKRNDFNRCFKTIQEALRIAALNKDDKLQALCYQGLVELYATKGNNRLALKYGELAYPLFLKTKQYEDATLGLNIIGVEWQQLGNNKKALDYYGRSLSMSKLYKNRLFEAFNLSAIGSIFVDSSGYEQEGIRYMEKANELFKQLDRPLFLAGNVSVIGEVYLKKKQYAKALPYIEQSWLATKKYNWNDELDDTNSDKELYIIHKALHHPAQALFHLERYNALVDSSLRSEIKSGRDVVQMQLDKANQQRQIDQLKIKELQGQKLVQNRSRQGLLSTLGLLLVLVMGIGWYTRELKVKNKDLLTKNNMIKEFGQKIQAVEIAALRAQMNPHFIFNCLNSIQYFTAQNDADTASDYLTKFSRLIRLVLENSRSERVTLANELETLRLYIEMEAMRFGHKVRYSIIVEPTVEVESIQIPPLLLQPFVENAIWHGLMHKPEGGSVTVEVQQPQDHLLHVEITDNGIGRAKAAEYKSKSATTNKSFGMKVTAERIDLINQLYNTQTAVQITDLIDAQGQPAGTRVTVDIPI